MGIGVPYYGESSFDPVEFIRRSWDETQAKQYFRDEQKAKGYTDFSKKLPSPKAWEESSAKALAAETSQVSQDFTNDVSSGKFNPMGTTANDLQYIAQYDKRTADLKNKADLYEAMKEKYYYAWQTAKNPTHQENIDQDLTQKNLDALMKEPDIYKKNELLQNPDLIVFKPKPVEVIDELSKAFNAYIPDLDKDITREDWDEKSGMFRTTTMEKMDPVKLDQSMDQVWSSLSEKVQNEFQRRYEAAPKSQKTANIDGAEIEMDVKDWFKAQYSPKFAEKMGVSYRNKSEEGAKDFSWGIPGKDESGKFITDNMTETKQIAISPDNKTEGKPVPVNAEGVIPMQGAFKVAFQMPNTISSFDATNGLPTKAGTSAWHIPDNVSFMPVATEDIYSADGKTKLVKKGDIVPADKQQLLIREGRPEVYEYDAFLTSLASHKQISAEIPGMIKGTGAEEIWPIDQYSMSHTTVTKWKEAEKYIKSKAAGLKLDTKELENFISEYLKELNSGRKSIDLSNEQALYENIYK
jgi:hypothetical protein